MLVFVIRSSLTINPNYSGIGNKFINPFYALWGLWLKLPKALTFHKIMGRPIPNVSLGMRLVC